MIKLSHSLQSKVFFIGCPHFWHKKIIEYTKRPFNSVEEMNETMINNWNSVVKHNDKVILHGDVIFNKGDIDPSVILNRLNGDILLSLGNHDDPEKLVRSSRNIIITRDILDIQVNGQNIVCFHYPMKSWNKAFHGSWHTYCHVHTEFQSPDDELSYNVSVEWNDYTPISFDKLQNIMNPKIIKWKAKMKGKI